MLKERNKLLTMAAQMEKLNRKLNGAERLEKVEEGMLNLLEVVAERENLTTEKQETDQTEEFKCLDEIGRVVVKKRQKDKMYHDERQLFDFSSSILDDGKMEVQE
ncbi:MAG: 39S ribosomal protein L47, mitochondrial, partial [Paramarteilia canceri]